MTTETIHRGHWPTPPALAAAGPVAEALSLSRARRRAQEREADLRATLSPEASARLDELDAAMGYEVPS